MSKLCVFVQKFILMPIANVEKHWKHMSEKIVLNFNQKYNLDLFFV